jgi:uncharacterized membrane protein YgdD (TMEM256/DUF423 family)
MMSTLPTRARYAFGASLTFLILGLVAELVDILTRSVTLTLASSILVFAGIALFAVGSLATSPQSRAPRVQIALAIAALIGGVAMLIPSAYRPRGMLVLIAIGLGVLLIVFVALMRRTPRSGS